MRNWWLCSTTNNPTKPNSTCVFVQYLRCLLTSAAYCIDPRHARQKSTVGLAMGAMKSLDKNVWRSRYLSRRTMVHVFRSPVMPVLIYSCKASTLTADLRRRLDSFATTSFCRILGYRWQNRVSNQEVPSRVRMSRVTCLMRERRLRFYGHVVCFPMDDLAHRILNAKDPAEWNRRRGRPNSSWLAQLGDHMKEWSMGPAQARAVAQSRPREWSRKVSAAKCRRGTCSHT